MVTNVTNVTMKKGTEKRVPAGEFKAKCLALFDEIETHKRSFVVTKRGRPVARVVPISAGSANSLRGSVLHEDGLLDPVGVKWDALS
jgi:prevent-host-death family protein